MVVQCVDDVIGADVGATVGVAVTLEWQCVGVVIGADGGAVSMLEVQCDAVVGAIGDGVLSILVGQCVIGVVVSVGGVSVLVE